MAGLLHILPAFRAANPEGTFGGSRKSLATVTTISAPVKSSISKRKAQAQAQALPGPSLLSKVIRDANNYVLSWRDGLSESERSDRERIEERKQILAARMHNSGSFAEWEAAARELDSLEGNDEWKLDASAGDYNPELIEEKLKELDDARIDHDIRAMMHLVRTALSRDLGGMGNIDLYRHSYIGTKDLIERYVDTAVKTVEAAVGQSSRVLPDGLEYKDLLEGMLYARQSFGRSALLLSGGATFGMAHIGVIKSLFEAKLLPRIISGASAGSIVCAVLCTRNDEEMPDLIATFPFGDLAVFEAQGDKVSDHVRRLLTEGSWSDIKHLTRVMRDLLGDITFQEAYNRTRRICNICVSTESMYDLPRLLNYVTAPNVMIWSAVSASCSVPLVFNAAPLLVKDPTTGAHIPWNPTPQRWIDGSVDNDLPMTRLAEMFNVNHFIVSQVNPHVVPFLSKDDRLYPSSDPVRIHASSPESNSDWLYLLTSLAKDEALHRLHFLTELGIFPNLFTKLRSILSQKYSGDITILPEITIQDLPHILSNPTPEFMIRNCISGEKATWPKLSRIRDRCAIELALDQAVHILRARVVFSKSQVDLRRMVTGSDQLMGGIPVGVGISATPGNLTREILRGPPSSTPEAALADDRRHRRRNSGSSIQLLARHKKFLQSLENALTDEETEQEERLEMSQRRPNHALAGQSPVTPASRANMSKPRLKRAAKSHFNLPLGTPLGSAPSAVGATTARVTWIRGFDFSKPLTPLLGSGNEDSGVAVDEGDATESPGLLPRASVEREMTGSSRLDIVSPTEDPSDGEPTTWDADVEDSRTDDSDVDSYRRDPRPDAEEDSLMIKPRGFARIKSVPVDERPSRLSEDSSGLWD